MSAPDLQVLATELLDELSAAHKMLAAALAQLGTAQLGTVGMISLSRRMRHEGLDSTDGGFTRAGVRADLIQRAGAALREAKLQAASAPPTSWPLGATIGRCVAVDTHAGRMSFDVVETELADLGHWYTIIPARGFNELVVMPEHEFEEFVTAAQACALRDACIAPAAIMARAVHTRAQEAQS